MLSFKKTAVLAASLLGLGAGAGGALAQVQQQCNLPALVQPFLRLKLDLNNALKAGSAAACRLDTDVDYCATSADLKAFVRLQDAGFQEKVVREAIRGQASAQVCVLCLVKGLYLTVVQNQNPLSIQKLCADLGTRVQSNDTLRPFYERMGCNFRISQAGLSDSNFGDAFWNGPENSVRFWLKRTIDDLKAGRPNNIVVADIGEAQELLQRFISSNPATQNDQDQLEKQFGSINCTPLATCTRLPVTCPPSSRDTLTPTAAKAVKRR